MNYKGALFFDIDGTLVDSYHNKGLEEEVLQAIRDAEKNGYYSFVSSGRNLSGLREFRNIGMKGYVYSDGAGILIEGQESVLQPLPDEARDWLFKTVLGYKGDMLAASETGFYATGSQYEMMYGMMEKIAERTGVPAEQTAAEMGLRRFEDYDPSDPLLEVDVLFDHEDIEKEFVRQLHPGLDYVSTTASYGRDGRTIGEITKKGIDKGSGAREILKLLGHDMKNTYAFGDSMNDASVLNACETGVAMGNAADELKQAADYVTDDISEHGLVNAMRHFGIID
ncbi:MAG: Cof-type HAD-IIB family hydrolase [Solobacterium sp.]|nr:Cof-type HAD-IIB family hydrolase [Solobacterium sp.]